MKNTIIRTAVELAHLAKQMKSDPREVYVALMAANAGGSEMIWHSSSLKHIGRGGTRDVYESAACPDVVVKYDINGTPKQNVLEYEVWQLVIKHDLLLKNWLAPCIDIGSNGQWIFQRRTTPVPDDMWPSEIPIFFSDTDKSNFGILDGRFVCHDYAINMMWKHGLSCEMKKWDWSTS